MSNPSTAWSRTRSSTDDQDPSPREPGEYYAIDHTGNVFNLYFTGKYSPCEIILSRHGKNRAPYGEFVPYTLFDQLLDIYQRKDSKYKTSYKFYKILWYTQDGSEVPLTSDDMLRLYNEDAVCIRPEEPAVYIFSNENPSYYKDRIKIGTITGLYQKL